MHRMLFALLLCLLVVVPVAAQDDPDPYPGTFVFLVDSLLSRYQDGTVSDACRVPITQTDNPHIDPSRPIAAQVATSRDIAYAPQTGLVALATNHVLQLADYSIPADDPYAAKNLYLCDLATDTVRRISPGEDVGFFHENPVFNPDGTQVTWMETDIDGESRVLRYDIAADTVTEVHQGIGRSVPSIGLAAYFNMVWADNGIAVIGTGAACETEGNALVVLPTDGDPVETCLERSNVAGNTTRPVLYWAQRSDETPVIVYALSGPTQPQVHAFDPASGEQTIIDGHLVAEPVAEASFTSPPPPPFVRIEVATLADARRLIAVTDGPSTLNGYAGGFAFSDDGDVLAMITSEGVGFSMSGNDLYLMESRDTLGALGYFVQAQQVSEGFPWGPNGVDAVYWGQHRYLIRE